MSDIKPDVKVSVKVFTQTAVSNVVRESTKKLMKSLTESQKKIFEAKIKNMSDDQLEQYFENDPYFKNALENTIKSVNDTPQENVSESWTENLQSVYEATYSKDLTKILFWPAPRVILAVVVCIALLAMVGFSMVSYDVNPDPVSPISPGKSIDSNIDSITFLDAITVLEQRKIITVPKQGKIISIPEQTEIPVANFSINVTDGYVPFPVQFTDLSENATGWNWDFGDGTNTTWKNTTWKNTTWKNTTHTYSTAGNYTVNLTVSNANGTDSKLANITVQKPPPPPPPSVLPVANFISNVTQGNPLSVQFTDLSENATEWNWDFGDKANSPEQNPTHTYSTAGNYNVTLTVTNGIYTDSKNATITVSKPPLRPPRPPRPPRPSVLPVANFISNVTQGNPLSVQFTDLSENVKEWNWDFGDKANSPEQNPTHTYSTAGSYNVTLTVTNGIYTDSKNATITVSKPPPPPSVLPVSNFSSNVTQGYTPLSVQFTDLSENATEWNWDFGDNAPSTEQNPMHTYSTAGIYNVNLTAINKNGTNSTHATITVQKFPDTSDPDKPYALYITNSESNNVSVINTSTNNVTATVPVGNCPWGVAVAPDGKKVYVVNHRGDNVSVIDTATNKVIATVPVGSYPWGVAISQAGTIVYVANSESNNVSVIDTATNKVIATVPVGSYPWGVAVNQAGTKVYVANHRSDNVSVIDTATNTVTSTVPVGSCPEGVAVTPDGKEVYVANSESNNVSVIDTATSTVTDNVPVGSRPRGVAVTPDGKEVYVANYGSNNVSVIDTATNTVTARVPVGSCPKGVAVTPDGKMVYVANYKSKNISVIDTENNTVIDNVPLESNPIAFGQFIGPLQY
ncbi:collagen triple helix repeat domain protein [Methanosarcina sp. MTP4]|uniref:PKD domain-containing protein n=1 Tax=Methanosarcina sp. MTP4 TaxID=1434100 RepID=UPI000615ABE9|nr:PKD domain-containing protein [Methanosarcina sp. MTP4]AKB25522.1 collagen triple helix repeat domain protein [Methanosarcina sp. MTP4]